MIARQRTNLTCRGAYCNFDSLLNWLVKWLQSGETRINLSTQRSKGVIYANTDF